MSRQVSHRRGTRRADAYPVAELAVALALMLAFLVALGLAGTSDYESMRATRAAEPAWEVAR
ncbi:hypothetical protein [Olsenella phocaeensis]|uniref:hypothetical protein n=1 Tax=Olsenella phocaeensis TaxID=1852385 RepID=UPI003A910E32